MNIEEPIERLKFHSENAGLCLNGGTTCIVNISDLDWLLTAYEKEKEKNKELENADLTTVYMNGFYDGKKKVEDKIKAKIEPRLKELDKQMKEEYNKYGNSREYQDMVDEYNFLQSLLEDKENSNGK